MDPRVWARVSAALQSESSGVRWSLHLQLKGIPAGKEEVRSQKRHGMGELTAAVGAASHREPEVCTSLLSVWRGSKARQMRSVAAGSQTLRLNEAVRLCAWQCLRRHFKADYWEFLFLFKCLMCLSTTESMQEVPMLHCKDIKFKWLNSQYVWAPEWLRCRLQSDAFALSVSVHHSRSQGFLNDLNEQRLCSTVPSGQSNQAIINFYLLNTLSPSTIFPRLITTPIVCVSIFFNLDLLINNHTQDRPVLYHWLSQKTVKFEFSFVPK